MGPAMVEARTAGRSTRWLDFAVDVSDQPVLGMVMRRSIFPLHILVRMLLAAPNFCSTVCLLIVATDRKSVV